MTRVEDENTSAWTRNIVTSTDTIQTNKHEYMYEEHSDECMYDGQTNKHEYMYEEHSDECMYDANQQ
jgi:hypothetical protein